MSDPTVLVDAVALASLVGILTAIYVVVPQAVARQVALTHQHPDRWAFWTTILIHRQSPTHTHLASNRLGVFVGTVPTWLLDVAVGCRGRYWRAAGVLLGPGAVVVNATSDAFYHSTRGW